MTDNDDTIDFSNETLRTPDNDDAVTRRMRGLEMIRKLSEAHISLAPHAPTQYMCAVGAQAGSVDLFTARRIYRAMLAAAAEHPTVN